MNDEYPADFTPGTSFQASHQAKFLVVIVGFHVFADYLTITSSTKIKIHALSVI